MGYFVAILICITGIAYGIVQLMFPGVFKKITSSGNAPEWMRRGWDPHSWDTRSGGLVWVLIWGGALIWVALRTLRHYGWIR